MGEYLELVRNERALDQQRKAQLAALDQLRMRGAAQFTVDGQAYEVRAVMFKWAPDDGVEYQAITLDDLALLLAADRPREFSKTLAVLTDDQLEHMSADIRQEIGLRQIERSAL